MKNSILAIAIPTYDRSEIVHDNLVALIDEVKKYSIPIYFSDNSSNDATKLVVSKLQKKYKFIFYEKNVTDLGHDKNSFFVLQVPDSKYVWLLGDGLSLAEGSVKKVLDIIESYNPAIISVNALNRDLDVKSRHYQDCNAVLNDLGWHVTLTGATIYSRNVINSVPMVNAKDFKNFPQIGLIFNYLSKNCSFFWANEKLIMPSPKKRGYWVKTMFSIFIDDWSASIRNLPGDYKNEIKENVIVEHSLKTKIFSFRALLSARHLGVYDLRLLRKYKKTLRNHSKLSFLSLVLVAVFPKLFLKAYVISKNLNSVK